MNSIGSWLAENGSKHALVINVETLIALVSVFRQSSKPTVYTYVMYLEIVNMEVLMFALRSLGPLSLGSSCVQTKSRAN